MNIFLKCLGKIAVKCNNVLIKYRTVEAIESFAEFGENSHITYPFLIRGNNEFTPGVKYIHIGDGVSLGSGLTLFATRAHVYIGKRTISGPHLTIMNGNHPADVIGSS